VWAEHLDMQMTMLLPSWHIIDIPLIHLFGINCQIGFKIAEIFLADIHTAMQSWNWKSFSMKKRVRLSEADFFYITYSINFFA